jgi:hypothetical protein
MHIPLQPTRPLTRNVLYQEHRTFSAVSVLVDKVLGAGSELGSGTVLMALPAQKDTSSLLTTLKLVLLHLVLRLSVACSSFESPNGSRYLYL